MAGDPNAALPAIWLNIPAVALALADVPFLVLELLEGCSLEGRLKAGPLALDETRRIAAEMLEALEALHNLKIIHRDLKPSNVFLTPHAVKLLDFGLARFTETPLVSDLDSASTATLLTAPRSIVGTLHFMRLSRLTACAPVRLPTCSPPRA